MVADASLNQAMDLDAFLEFAKTATEKYEYIDGQLYLMAGEDCEIRAIGFRCPVSAVYERTTIPAGPAPAAPAEQGKQED